MLFLLGKQQQQGNFLDRIIVLTFCACVLGLGLSEDAFIKRPIKRWNHSAADMKDQQFSVDVTECRCDHSTRRDLVVENHAKIFSLSDLLYSLSVNKGERDKVPMVPKETMVHKILQSRVVFLLLSK